MNARLGAVWMGVALLLMTGCSSGKRSLSVDGVTRSYYVHVPASYTAGEPMPLLLALHQFSDTAAGMRRLTGFDAIAEREGFIVCYPQGRFRVWNSGQRDDESDVAFLSALVESITAEYAIDRARVYATGISAGGMMAQYLACRTDLLAGVAAVAGSPVRRVLEECQRDAPLPILLIHGEEDGIVPYRGGEVTTGAGDMSFPSAMDVAKAWARINGCAESAPVAETLLPRDAEDPSRVTRYTFPCPAGGEVVFLSVGGGGHTWPAATTGTPASSWGPRRRSWMPLKRSGNSWQDIAGRWIEWFRREGD